MKFHSTTILTITTLTNLFFHTSTALAASSSSTSTLLELKYFNARGAAETARILLALADGEGNTYKDTRYEITPGTMNSPAFLQAKELGELDANLGRAPLLLVHNDDQEEEGEEGGVGGGGGVAIGQSKAIERYLAKKYNFMGNTDIEAAQIDCIVEHCRDVSDAARRKGFSIFTPNKTEEEKATARKEWFEKDFPQMLHKINKVIALYSKEDGYAVGTSTSYADIVIFCLLGDCTLEADQVDTTKAASECSLLTGIVDRIRKNDKVSKWLQERPETKF